MFRIKTLICHIMQKATFNVQNLPEHYPLFKVSNVSPCQNKCYGIVNTMKMSTNNGIKLGVPKM